MQIQTTDIDGSNATIPAEQDGDITNEALLSAVADASSDGCAIAGTNLEGRGSEKQAVAFAVQGNNIWDNLEA